MLMLSKTCEIDKKLAKDTHHENVYNNFLTANLSTSISDLFWPKLNITKSHQRKYDKYPPKVRPNFHRFSQKIYDISRQT
jgi:hypothetical protein